MYHRILTFAFSIACLLAMVIFMRQVNTTPYGLSHHSILMKIAHHTSGMPPASSEAPPSARV